MIFKNIIKKKEKWWVVMGNETGIKFIVLKSRHISFHFSYFSGPFNKEESIEESARLNKEYNFKYRYPPVKGSAEFEQEEKNK